MADLKKVLGMNEIYAAQVAIAKQLKENKVLPQAGSNSSSEDFNKRKNIIDQYWKTRSDTRFVEYRGAYNPDVYPTIDDVPTDWDTWDRELARLKKSPFSVSKRLGVTERKPQGIDSRKWNALSARVTSIVGERAGGTSEYEKTLKSIASERLVDKSSDIFDINIIKADKLKDFAAAILGPAVDAGEVILGGNKNIVGIIFANGVLSVTVKPINPEGSAFRRGVTTFEITPRKDAKLAKNSIENLIRFIPKATDTQDLDKYYYDIGHGDSYAASLLSGLIEATKKNESTARGDKNLDSDERAYLVRVFTEQRKELEEELEYLKDKDGGDFAFKYNGQDVADIYGVPLTREENLFISRQLVDKSGAFMKIVSIIDQVDGTRSITVTEDTTISVNFDSKQYRIQFDNFNRSSAKFGKIALNRLDKIMREPRSPPPLAKLMVASLVEIFYSKEEAKKYLSRNKSKKRKTTQTIKLTKNPPKKLNLQRPNSTTQKRKLREKKTKTWVINSRDTTQDIVSLINAEIYQYVRAQMSENTLQYRTGEFARSVRVLSAQENAAVQYTYKKNPYSDVFSPGKSYLATEDRNPAKIIDAAIKRLGQDRFQKVFRTEEV